MSMHFELSDFSPEVQKKIMRKIAEEDRRKKQKEDPLAYVPKDFEADSTDEPKRSKYGAEKITTTLYDGTEYTFDSKKEYRRYQELEIEQLAGEITELKLQVPFELVPKQIMSDGSSLRSVRYIADFCYKRDGKCVIEDVKGYRKGNAYQIFKIKKKLMKYVYDLEVSEV